MSVCSCRSAGFTFVEVLLAIVLLAGAVMSMGFALESSRRVDAGTSRLGMPEYLLQDAVAWAHTLERKEPDAPATFGPEPGETPATYDDIDDIDGLLQSSLKDLGGEALGGEWARGFVVESVDPANPSLALPPGASNLVRLSVSVFERGVVVATEVVLFWRPF